MNDNGRSWVKREPAAERALTHEEEDRVMDEDGRSWIRRQADAAARSLTKEDADRVMVDDGRSWVRRELATARVLTKEEENRLIDDEWRSWSKRELEAAEDASKSTGKHALTLARHKTDKSVADVQPCYVSCQFFLPTRHLVQGISTRIRVSVFPPASLDLQRRRGVLRQTRSQRSMPPVISRTSRTTRATER